MLLCLLQLHPTKHLCKVQCVSTLQCIYVGSCLNMKCFHIICVFSIIVKPSATVIF